MKGIWQSLLQKLKTPKGWFLAFTYLLTVVSCAGAIALAVINSQKIALQILSYVAYALAAVTLGYSVYSIVIYAPTMKERVTRLIKRTAFGRRMLSHYGFRTVIFATCSLVVNIAYVGLNVALAITSYFFWYGSLALYYGLLVALRSGIVLYHRRKTKGAFQGDFEQKQTEIHKYRVCGIMLTIIPFTLTVPILQIIFLDRAFVHEGWTVIAFAAYAFYKITMAIYNVIKSQKQTDMTIQAVRSVGLADALVSIFSLQTALLYAFSEAGTDVRAFNVVTGVLVCVLTIALGVFMLVKSNKKIKELKGTKENERKQEQYV